MVEKRLDVVRNYVRDIINECQLLLEDIKDVEVDEDTYVMEARFQRVERAAEAARLRAREVFD